MSLTVFKTELIPSPGLRKLVLICGVVALLTGILIILYLPLPPVMRGAISILWSVDCARELRMLKLGAARISHLQLDANGDIFATGFDGRSEYLVLLSGSVVLSRVAWLRLRFPDGSVFAELMLGDPASDPRWQRLQLIWQQRQAAFAARQ